MMCWLLHSWCVFTKPKFLSVNLLWSLLHSAWPTVAMVNWADKVRTLDIAAFPSESPLQKCSGMARVLKGVTTQFYGLPAHPHVHLQLEWAIPDFAFPAIAGTHLTTLEGWKAEWTLVWSSPSRDSSLQPSDYKSGILPHSH